MAYNCARQNSQKKMKIPKISTKNKSTLKRKDIIESVPGNAVEQSWTRIERKWRLAPAAEGRKKSLAGQATLGACGASFWGSRVYSHSSIWVLLILINLAAAISIVVTVFRVIFYISCAKIQNKFEIQWYEPIQFALFIGNMYSISKRTVLLMDFHYSMLLLIESVCYTLLYK